MYLVCAHTHTKKTISVHLFFIIHSIFSFIQSAFLLTLALIESLR